MDVVSGAAKRFREVSGRGTRVCLRLGTNVGRRWNRQVARNDSRETRDGIMNFKG